MISCNIVILSYRSTAMAHELVRKCHDICMSTPGVEISLGYGGANHNDIEIYNDLSRTAAAKGAEFRLLVDEDIQTRVTFCLASSKIWTMFLSDDDPFSHNYIRALIRTAEIAEPEVSIITPTSYLKLNTDGSGHAFRPVIAGANVLERYASLLKSQFADVGFYAVHRTANVKLWREFIMAKGYYPSYVDHLLVTFGVLMGSVKTAIEQTVWVWDMSNWADPETTNRSDAKFYPGFEFVVFHELFWCVDMMRLFKEAGQLDQLIHLHVQYWKAMLGRLTERYSVRMKMAGTTGHPAFDGFKSLVKDHADLIGQVEYVDQAYYLLNSLTSISLEINQMLLQRMADKAACES